MSIISQISVDGTTYDICDATSRTALEDLENSVSSLANSVSTHTTQISSLQSTASSNSTQITTNKNNISSLKTSVNSLLHVERVIVWLNANSDHVEVTAPSVSGYKFIIWVTTASIGWIGATYVNSPLSATADIWTNDLQSSRQAVYAWALYAKNV